MWAVARKDLLIERRAKAAFNAMAFFAGLVLLTFGFALGPDVPAGESRQGTLLQELAPGLLWVTILFAGVLAVDRSFQLELERGGFDALRLYPGDRKALYVGKLIANVTIMLVMEILIWPPQAAVFLRTEFRSLFVLEMVRAASARSSLCPPEPHCRPSSRRILTATVGRTSPLRTSMATRSLLGSTMVTADSWPGSDTASSSSPLRYRRP